MTMALGMKISLLISIMMMMMIIISAILMNFIHPLMLILILVLFTTTNLSVMYLSTTLSMYTFMIFISIIGGMMIMFLYFTSMLNNYPSKIKLSEVGPMLYLFLVMLMTLYSIIAMAAPDLLTMFANKIISTSNVFIYKVYLYPMSLMTVATIWHLLYCLALTIKMSSMKYLPLRKIDYEKI